MNGYLRDSALTEEGLQLETAGGSGPAGVLVHPRFFAGFVVEAEPVAKGLLAVAAVARARYFVPMTAATKAAILDPVVTCDGAGLQFESFSACCGAYARLAVSADGLDGDLLERGTTNVDVNAPLQTALARVGGQDPLHLAVGPDALTVRTLEAEVTESQVVLPQRWLRGFAEAPVVLSGMALRAEVGTTEARRFLRALPRGSSRAVLWVLAAGRSLRLTTRPVAGAVCLAGPQRLEQLQGLLRHATALRVYGPEVHGGPAASAWELVLPGSRLVVTLSPDLPRGFSGEGGTLTALAGGAADDADAVADALSWLPSMSLAEVSIAAGLDPDRTRAALLALGTAGRVGHEVSDGSWFARDLPYAPAGDQPRLVAARRLVAENRLERTGDVVLVRSPSSLQHVHLGPRVTCTCPWYARHETGRGPCKHVLAAGLMGWT